MPGRHLDDDGWLQLPTGPPEHWDGGAPDRGRTGDSSRYAGWEDARPDDPRRSAETAPEPWDPQPGRRTDRAPGDDACKRSDAGWAGPAPADPRTPGRGAAARPAPGAAAWPPAARPPAADPAPARRTTTGRRLSVAAVTVAVVASLALGVSCYSALASVSLASLDPLGEAGVWVSVAGVSGAFLVGAVVAALVALVQSKRATAGAALAVTLLLPPAAVWLGMSAGVDELTETVTREVGSAGDGVVRDLLDDALERFLGGTPREA